VESTFARRSAAPVVYRPWMAANLFLFAPFDGSMSREEARCIWLGKASSSPGCTSFRAASRGPGQLRRTNTLSRNFSSSPPVRRAR
jgi:hypothetical protein